MAKPVYRRKGRSPTNENIVVLEAEDGREVPVTSELADMLAGPEEEQRLGGPGASDPIAQGPNQDEANAMVDSYLTPQGRNELAPLLADDAMHGATPGMPALQQPQIRQPPQFNVGSAPAAPTVPPRRASSLNMTPEALAQAAALPPSPQQGLPAPPAAPVPAAPDQDTPAGQPPMPTAAQAAVAGDLDGNGMLSGQELAMLGVQPTAAQLRVADLNGNGVVDLFEQRTGGSGGTRVRETVSQTQAGPVDPASVDRLRLAGDIEADAASNLGLAQREGVDAIARREGQLNQQLSTQDRAIRDAQAKADAQASALTGRRQEAAQRFLTGQVDPERYLSSRGTWGRVGAAIAMTLRDVAGIYAGRDLGPGLIEQEIERDIQAQMANLEQGARAFTANGQLMQEMMTIFQDPVDAANAARQTMLEAALRDIRVMTLNSTSNEMRARGALTIANIERQLAQLDIQNQQAARRTTIETQRTGRIGGSPARVTGQVTPESLNAYRQAGGEDDEPSANVPAVGFRFQASPRGEEGRLVWGSAGTEEQGRVRRGLAMDNGVLRTLARLRDMVRNRSSFSPRDRAEAQARVNWLLPRLNQTSSGTPNALQGAEIELWQEVAVNPTRIASLNDSNAAALDAAIDEIRSSQEAVMDIYGFERDSSALDEARSRAGGR